MYAGTQFEWIDKSQIPEYDVAVVDNAPMFAQTFSSDIGPEELTIYTDKNFFDLCGTISYARHGQPLLQAANIIMHGGKVVGKRIVAPDATLANIILVLEMYSATRPKTDPVTGDPLYLQDDGTESTTVSATPVTENYVNLTWKASSVENASGRTEVENQLEDPALYNPTGTEKTLEDGNTKVTVFTYPVFTFIDNGRGVSTKKIRFYSDYETSKTLKFMLDYVYVMVGTDDKENCRFASMPDTIYGDNNYSLENRAKEELTQVKVIADEDIMSQVVNKIAELSGVDVSEIETEDFLFGKTRKGKDISYINVDLDEGIDLASANGISLLNGSNGSFGDAPLKSEDYNKETLKFWNGEFTDEIWDRDTYPIAAIFDANYDDSIKRAIEKYVMWREDNIFFEDMGTGLTTYESIYAASQNVAKSRFVTVYCTAYDIRDTFTKKQVAVTCTYTLAGLMVSHIANGGVYRAAAGMSNGFVAPEAIEGTVNFTPRITPTVNQKTLLEEIRVNYAAYVGTNRTFTFETLYTTQDYYSQLSFSNNVMAVEAVARVIRDAMPSLRYSTLDEEGLEAITFAINNILIGYRGYFETLNYVYVEDRLAVNNKIYKAGLEFLFKNFAQAELFTLTALPIE